MTDSTPAVRLVFVNGFSERQAAEAADRGYLSHVLVEVGGVRSYPVLFYDPVRLAQDLEDSVRHGRPFVAEPGLIVMPDLIESAMSDAVLRLHQEGFFDYLVPLTPEQIAKTGSLEWPP